MNSVKKQMAILLILLGITMVYIGAIHFEKIMFPPIITGIGFFAISIVFLKDKSQ